MIVIGLTGSIASGKSVTAGMLRRLRIPVHDADASVHRLLAPGGAAVAAVAALFPKVLKSTGGIDRIALGARVFNDMPSLRALEGVLHPLVRRDKQVFVRQAARRRVPLVVLDVPLLFETGGERSCDAVILIDAPRFLRRDRALRRAGMTRDKFRAIAARQMPDAEKLRRTPYVVRSGLGRRPAWRALLQSLAAIEARSHATCGGR